MRQAITISLLGLTVLAAMVVYTWLVINLATGGPNG